ncbi:response regulator transcription factor [Streptomyces flavofungini]|uniref:Response regulator transcription factor n=1 Tax=Streptomyces flavofungini TaxID=68200 RepID=A0ABS0X7Z7_9ACTN|nr:response regulator transcription factor [Streptomyces flavofungini]MBJ3809259.1 response regulator transcription factor [Streptomyces flavofungini]GHC77224.1 DNA-binding response regulator [Streptomyces flavofungini]
MTAAAVRVLTVDDQELVSTALRAMLRRTDVDVVGEAADGVQAVAAAFALRPDVVLMDVRMPGMTGVEATRRILDGWPHPGPRPRVLMLTTFDLDEYVHAALRAGASGFLLKNTTPQALVEAIGVVAAGEAMLAPTVTRRLIRAFSDLPPPLLPGAPSPVSGPQPNDPLSPLTTREREVARLVAQGLSNARIATALGLTQPGVKSTINRILTRLRLENRVQIAVLVLTAEPEHGTEPQHGAEPEHTGEREGTGEPEGIARKPDVPS